MEAGPAVTASTPKPGPLAPAAAAASLAGHGPVLDAELHSAQLPPALGQGHRHHLPRPLLQHLRRGRPGQGWLGSMR